MEYLVEYKYVIRDKHNTTWENGPNRLLDLSQYQDNKNICVEDVEFNMTEKAAQIIVKEEIDLLASFNFFPTKNEKEIT